MSKKVVIAGACRTAIGTMGGSLSGIPAAELGAIVIKEAVNRAGIKPSDVDQVYMGCVIQAGQGQNVARQATIKAGLPIEVPAVTMNVVCEIPTNRAPFALNGLLHKLVPSNRVHVANNLYVRRTGKGKPSGWPRDGVRTIDGTEEDPIDLGFVDLPAFRWSDERYSYYDEMGDFNLKPNARLLKELPGFAPIPWDKIGLYEDQWRKRLPHFSGCVSKCLSGGDYD